MQSNIIKASESQDIVLIETTRSLVLDVLRYGMVSATRTVRPPPPVGQLTEDTPDVTCLKRAVTVSWNPVTRGCSSTMVIGTV